MIRRWESKSLISMKKWGKMAVYLTDGREVPVPIGHFPEIKKTK